MSHFHLTRMGRRDCPKVKALLEPEGRKEFRGLSPPDATETEQSTHEKPEVDTAVTDRASPLPLHTHPTRKVPEETDGKRVLYMKLVANAF